MVMTAHRWLGLGSSLVLALVGGSGVFLVAPGLPFGGIAGRVHETLGLGVIGLWIVIVATAVAVILELSGMYLWWKQKLLKVRIGRGVTKTLSDLHHLAGMVGLPLMLMLALTGLGMAFVTSKQPRELVVAFHTSRSFSKPIKLVYIAATCGFLIQGLTGIVMWWKPSATKS
jgi:uncharacterized iron-regulated membrane protein